MGGMQRPLNHGSNTNSPIEKKRDRPKQKCMFVCACVFDNKT